MDIKAAIKHGKITVVHGDPKGEIEIKLQNVSQKLATV